MIERQPVLLAGMALAGADGLVERVVARRAAEHLHIARAKERRRRLAERDLGDGHQHELAQGLRGALRVGVEGLDALDRVAEEIEAHRARASGREEIEDAAAHRVLAGLHDRPGADIAREAKPVHEPVHVGALTGRNTLDGATNEGARRDALQSRVHGREHDHRLGARAERETRERRDAARDDLGIRAHTVVGHGVPGGEGNDAHLGRKKAQLRFERIEAAVVARDVHDETRRRPGARFGRDLRENERIQPFRNAGKGQVGLLFGLRSLGAHAALVAFRPVFLPGEAVKLLSRRRPARQSPARPFPAERAAIPAAEDRSRQETSRSAKAPLRSLRQARALA